MIWRAIEEDAVSTVLSNRGDAGNVGKAGKEPGFSTLVMCAQSTISFEKASIPGVAIIDPGSPGFSGAIQPLVDRAVLHEIQGVLPFCYVLKNNSDKLIIVYSTRWTLTDSSGEVTVQDRTWWNLTTLRDDDAIPPGTSKLVTPIFRLGVPNFGPTGVALSRELQRTLGAFGTKQKVVTSLETVIFEDGIALGTDATNAAAQAQAHFDAGRQVGDLITQTAAAGGNVTEALRSLAPDQSGPRSYRVSNPIQYDESLALRRQSLASLLMRMTPNQLTAFVDGVAKNRSLNIFKRPNWHGTNSPTTET